MVWFVRLEKEVVWVGNLSERSSSVSLPSNWGIKEFLAAVEESNAACDIDREEAVEGEPGESIGEMGEDCS